MKRMFRLCSLLPLLLAACHPAALQLRINAPSGTNQGRPLYMLVRKVDPKQYATESYGEVSARVVQADPNIVHSEIIYPGTLRRLEVKVPQDASLAVSFLFTAPDGKWQEFLGTPLPPSLNVDLREGSIQTGGVPPAPSQEEAKPAPAASEPAKS